MAVERVETYDRVWTKGGTKFVVSKSRGIVQELSSECGFAVESDYYLCLLVYPLTTAAL